MLTRKAPALHAPLLEVLPVLPEPVDPLLLDPRPPLELLVEAPPLDPLLLDPRPPLVLLVEAPPLVEPLLPLLPELLLGAPLLEPLPPPPLEPLVPPLALPGAPPPGHSTMPASEVIADPSSATPPHVLATGGVSPPEEQAATTSRAIQANERSG